MFGRKRTTQDFTEEIQAHIELDAEGIAARGLERRGCPMASKA